MTIQLNLLPDVKKEYIRTQKTKGVVISTAIIVTLAAIGLSVLLFVYVTFMQQIHISLIGEDIKNKTVQLNNIKDLGKYLTIQNQLKSLTGLHEQKGIYSRVFNFLPLLNPKDPNSVKISMLQTSSLDKTMTLNGTTASFESMNVFVDTLTNAEVKYKDATGAVKSEKMFSKITVLSSGLAKVNNTTLVSFSIQTMHKESVFDARNSDVTASVPSIETTPSVTGSPQQLFQSQGGQ